MIVFIKTAPSVADTKEPDIWEVSSTSMYNTSAERNYRVTNNILRNYITSTAYYNLQT